MKLKFGNRRVNLSEFLFYCAWGLYSITYLLFMQTEFSKLFQLEKINNYVIYFSMLLLLMSLLIELKLTVKGLILTFGFVIVILLLELNRTGNVFSLYLMFILCFKQGDIRELIQFNMKIKLFCFLSTVILCMLGVIDNYTTLINDSYKQALGYLHPNIFGVTAYSLLLDWLYLRWKKIRLFEWPIIFGLGVITYWVAAARAAAYPFFLIIILFVLARYKPIIFKKKWVQYAFVCSTPLLTVLSFGLAYLYMKEDSFARRINEMLTGRLSFAVRYLTDYGFSIFGQNIKSISTRTARAMGVSSEILDMSYIRAPITYGIIFSTFILIAFMVLEKKSFNNANVGLAIFILYYIAVGFAETYMLIPTFNVTMVLSLNVLRESWEKQKYMEKINVRKKGLFTFQRE